MARNASRVQRKAPVRLTASTLFQTSSSRASNHGNCPEFRAETSLAQKFLRHFTAVFCQFSDHLFVQPHIHRGRIVFVAGIMQFFRQ